MGELPSHTALDADENYSVEVWYIEEIEFKRFLLQVTTEDGTTMDG
jgi:hypothetical protein